VNDGKLSKVECIPKYRLKDEVLDDIRMKDDQKLIHKRSK